ncbi:MAG: hypothetical protein ABL888_05440 [Pirellulaceae bacterium]
MAFHIPFEHRRRPQPIYIGFEAPARPKRKRNWTGFFGFLFSFFSLFTAGVLSPLALLVCLFGLRKKPRGFAAAGTVVSLLGTALIGTIITGAVMSEARHRRHAEQVAIARENQEKSAATMKIMEDPAKEMKDWVADHEGYFPDDITGNMLTIKFEDNWGKALRFESDDNLGFIRSAGPDGSFDTKDDLTVKLEGKTDAPGKVSVE